jgi:hypothetical protein
MKRLIYRIDQLIIGVCFLFCLVYFCGLIFSSPAAGDNSVADEIISLDVTNQSLDEVLEQISTVTGYQFTFDESWADYPITASFENEPLFRGLKRIFRNISTAIIYGTDRTIKIIIYDQGPPAGKSVGQSVIIKSSQDPVQPSQPFGEATAPQPEVEISEEDSSSENTELQSEESSESVSEANEAGAEETEPMAEDSDEAAADSEVEQKESAAEDESNQTDDTQSAN